MMATGLSRPGKSREGPGTGRDRTGPRDLEGPVVLAGQDLETLKVPGLKNWKSPGRMESLVSTCCPMQNCYYPIIDDTALTIGF